MDANSLFKIIQSRRSVRKFTEQPVAREQILRLVDAARWAPSNHNRQGWKFLVYDNRAQIRTLADSVEKSLGEGIKKLPSVASAYAGKLVQHAALFAEAPLLIVALHKRPAIVSAPLLQGTENPVLVSGEAISTAMAVQNLLLAAHAIGLGGCVMTAPLLAPDAMATLDLPSGYHVTCFIALGHPAETPVPPRRKECDQVVEFRSSPECPLTNEN